jgi:hypothetical protein
MDSPLLCALAKDGYYRRSASHTRQAWGHWFEPSTAHCLALVAEVGFAGVGRRGRPRTELRLVRG